MLGRMLCLALVIYLTVVVLMMLFEERFIFFPDRYDGSSDWQPVALDYQDIDFQAADGTRLHGWYCPHEEPRAVILFAHGNAGNITHRTDIARRLQRMGTSVFLFDYRGYGRSEGSPGEQGILRDARAARKKLAELAGIDEADIVVMGRSLGGAVAVDLAGRDGARGLIVESSFSSMPDVAAVHYSWLPVRWVVRNRFDSITKIKGYKGPLLQSHGEADRTIPIELGQRLFDACPGIEGESKQFYSIAGWDHNDRQPPRYYELLDRFIDELP